MPTAIKPRIDRVPTIHAVFISAPILTFVSQQNSIFNRHPHLSVLGQDFFRLKFGSADLVRPAGLCLISLGETE